MSKRDRDVSISFGGVWFFMFILVKAAGTSLASWSWWWLLLPIVPCFAFIFGKLGWTL